MTQEFFGPLEDVGFGIGKAFNYDKFKLWIERQQLNFQKTISIQGDLLGNWDGAQPLDLSSVDATASTGYALDASEGAAQFMGDMFVGGELRLIAGGTLSTGVTGARYVRIPGGEHEIDFMATGGTARAQVGLNVNGFAPSGGDSLELVAYGTVTNRIQIDDVGGVYFSHPVVAPVGLTSIDGVSFPGYTFRGDTDTGIYRPSSDQIGFSLGGVIVTFRSDFAIFGGSGFGTAVLKTSSEGTAGAPAFTFGSDTDTGLYRRSGDSFAATTGGTDRMWWQNDGVYVRTIPTSGTAADVHLNGSGRIQRTTSSLKYKPGWQFVDEDVLASLELPTPITWEEEESGTMLGFGTEHIHAML